MIFYKVEDGRVIERFMCDNPKCQHYRTRYGMPMQEGARTRFQVKSMEEFDACSSQCREVIEETQKKICG